LKYIVFTIAAIFLFLFIREIDINELSYHYDLIGFRFFGILVISTLAYTLATVGWLYCMNKGSFFRQFKLFFLVRLLGETLGILNPTGIVGGDAFKAYLLKDKAIPSDTIIPSVITSRALLWVSFLLVSVVSILIALTLGSKHFILLLSNFFVFLFAAGTLTYLLFRPNGVSSVYNKLSRVFRWKYLLDKRQQVENYNKVIRTLWLDKKKYVILAIIAFSLHYFFGALEFWYILSCLNIDISIGSALVLEVGTSLVRSLMLFIPGQIGVEEYSNKMFLELVGVNQTGVWVTVSLIRRVRQLIWIILAIIVYFSYFSSGEKKQRSPYKHKRNGSLIH